MSISRFLMGRVSGIEPTTSIKFSFFGSPVVTDLTCLLVPFGGHLAFLMSMLPRNTVSDQWAKNAPAAAIFRRGSATHSRPPTNLSKLVLTLPSKAPSAANSRLAPKFIQLKDSLLPSDNAQRPNALQNPRPRATKLREAGAPSSQTCSSSSTSAPILPP